MKFSIEKILLLFNRLRKRTSTKFAGRVIPSDYDFQTIISDITGSHQVWYPKSQEDVAAAIALSRGFKTFVKSGRQVARQDIVDGTNGIVINLSELVQVSVQSNLVIVEAAATYEDVVEQLTVSGLALPISDDPLKSIVSIVLSESLTYFSRSLGTLSDFVSELRAVEPDGTPAIFDSSENLSCLERWQKSKGVITQVTLEASPAENLWMQRHTFPYPGASEFLTLLQALFSDTDLPMQCDLVLDVYSGVHLLPIVRVTALGSHEEGGAELRERISTVLGNLTVDLRQDSFAGTEVFEAILDAGQGAGLDPSIDSEKLDRIETVDQGRAAFLGEYANYIHRGIAYSEDGEGKLERDLNISARLQVNQDDALEITGYAYTPNGLIMEYTTPMPSFAANPTTRRPIPRHEKVPMLFPLKAPSGPIPNFKGDVYERDDWGYRRRAKVYATTSYPEKDVTPFMVAYPRDLDDIVAAIAFAHSEELYIVARSGGHQYSGKSSGGQKTIVLSMDAFNHLQIEGNIAKVGPAVSLTTLAKEFKRKNITIPHGECSKVAIGGHAQTGGYGHLVRNFGLALDYVEELDIVLADGTLHTVKRPAPGSSPANPDEQIFWGVLGGNAGSFGIVTNYTFKCIEDSQYKNSFGYAVTRQYKKNRYLKLMREVQSWTKEVEAGTLPSDIDLMMTVESVGRMPFFPVLLVEAVHKNLPVQDRGSIPDARLQAIQEAVSTANSLWENILPTKIGPEDLSELSDSFVRRWPATTLDGREFQYPYRKRINCTTKALTDEFVVQFVDMVDKVVSDITGVKLVFQMLIGGGEYQNTNRRPATSIPHRDYVFCFIFDLFYTKIVFKKEAEDLQKEMQKLVDTHFSKDQEQRVFWGSFGDTNIKDATIREMYYDSEQDYQDLQRLKARVDPNDIFHTSLTVQLP